MRVPRVTEQQVAIAPLPNARQQLRVSADTFGAQRARRLFQGAEGLAEAGDALARVAFERQADRIEAEAEAAFARWQVAATDTLAGYRGLQGGDAVGAYDAAYAELTGLRERIGGELGGGGGGGGGRVQDLFLRQVANRQPAFLAGLERHRDAQSQVYRSAAMDARLQSAVAAGLADPLLGPGAELEIQALAQQQGEALGLPPEAVEAIGLGYISQIHVGRVEGLLTEGRGAEARAYLETHGPRVAAADRLRFDGKIKAVERTTEVTALYQAIASGGPLPAFAREQEVDSDAATSRGGGGDGSDESNRGSDGNGDSGLDRSSADPNSNDATRQGAPAEVEPSVSAPGSPAAFDFPAAFGPRATAAQAKAAAQAELLAGSPEAAPHELHRDRMARLAKVETENPQVLGGAADELTAAYERETMALQADKATAQAEIARNLRSGAATPASLPPDLAAVLSGEEQAELEDWWRDGLRVSPDAALFESLHALFPAFPEEVSLEAPRIARHLSPEQQALVRRRQTENETPGAPGAATGEGAAAGDRVSLAGLDETLEEAGFDAWAEDPDGPWGVKRRRVSTLPDDPDPRETQLAVGIFGDDGGDGGGRDGGEGETSPQQSAQDAEIEADETDVEDTTQGEQETTVLDGIKLLPNAAAEELSRIQKELAERTDLSEEEIEAYGRDILKLTPGLGEVLSAQDAVDALRAAREALVNKDFQAALSSTAEGLVELGGAIPFLGKLVRGGKIGLRVARDLAKRLGRTSLGRGLRQKANRDDRRPEGQLPAGSVARINTPNGVKADVDTFEATHRHLERLYDIAEDVGVRHVDAVSGLLHGGRLNTRVESGKEIVNIEHLGGRAAAEAAFREAIGKAGGKLSEVRPWPRGGVAWEAPDGTKYRLYQSKNHGETVLIAVPSPRAPVSIKEWQMKLRYLEPQKTPSVD